MQSRTFRYNKLTSCIQSRSFRYNKLKSCIQSRSFRYNQLKFCIQSRSFRYNKLKSCIESRSFSYNRLKSCIESRSFRYNKLKSCMQSRSFRYNQLKFCIQSRSFRYNKLKSCTAISKKVFIVNSRYWNRKELWGSSSTNNLLLLTLTLQNGSADSSQCHGHSVTILASALSLIMTVPKVPFGSSIDILTMATFFEIDVYRTIHLDITSSSLVYRAHNKFKSCVQSRSSRYNQLKPRI